MSQFMESHGVSSHFQDRHPNDLQMLHIATLNKIWVRNPENQVIQTNKWDENPTILDSIQVLNASLMFYT